MRLLLELTRFSAAYISTCDILYKRISEHIRPLRTNRFLNWFLFLLIYVNKTICLKLCFLEIGCFWSRLFNLSDSSQMHLFNKLSTLIASARSKQIILLMIPLSWNRCDIWCQMLDMYLMAIMKTNNVYQQLR